MDTKFIKMIKSENGFIVETHSLNRFEKKVCVSYIFKDILEAVDFIIGRYTEAKPVDKNSDKPIGKPTDYIQKSLAAGIDPKIWDKI